MVTRLIRPGSLRPLESAVQKAYFDWAKTQWVPNPKGITRDMKPLTDYLFAIPNGQMLAGNAQQRARMMNAMKQRGFRNGVSDVMLALPRGRFHGAFIELKRDDKEHPTDDQDKFLNIMADVGYWCCVARGLESAINCTTEYLRYGPPTRYPS